MDSSQQATGRESSSTGSASTTGHAPKPALAPAEDHMDLTSALTFQDIASQAVEKLGDQGSQEDEVVGQDIHVLECQPTAECLRSVLYPTLLVKSVDCSKIFEKERKNPEYGQQIVPCRLLFVNKRQKDDDGEKTFRDFKVDKTVDWNVCLNDKVLKE